MLDEFSKKFVGFTIIDCIRLISMVIALQYEIYQVDVCNRFLALDIFLLSAIVALHKLGACGDAIYSMFEYTWIC